MKRYLLFIFILITALQITGQGRRIEIQIMNLSDRMIYLSNYYKSGYSLLDSVMSQNGSCYFYLSENQHVGMYKLDLQHPGSSDNQKNAGFIEFVWADESFQIYADYLNLNQTIVFDNSSENELMGEFRKYEALYEEKMSTLYPLIDRYPEEDIFFKDACKYFEQLQEGRDSFIQKIVKDNPELFASKIIATYRANVLLSNIRGQERMVYLRQHFFERTPIDKAELLYAPVYNSKIIEYLKLYRSQNYSFIEQEDAFIQAVDAIMANVSGDPELRSFVIEYLLEGFQSFGMEKIQTYIVDTYVDETCETDIVDLAAKRVEGYRKMAEGEVAADIVLRADDNRMVRLSEIDSDYILVIFWATNCQHCADLMPKIGEWYNKEKPENLEVFAISIDTVKTDWEKYNKLIRPQWINTHEPLGWKGKSAEDYNIYATPTMFLLDRNRRIITRPYTLRELKKDIAKLE